MTQTRKITLTGLGMALVVVATLMIRIPNGFQGYVNIGDTLIFAFAIIVDPISAFLIGGVGSALADIAGGYGYYALFTLVVKGLEGVFAYYLFHKLNKAWLSYLLAGAWMVLGYFIADIFVNQSVIAAALSVPPNMIQGVASTILACCLTPLFLKFKN